MSVLLTDTTLSQLNRSWLAGRFETAELTAIAERLDKSGFSALEVCDVSDFLYLTFLDVDPWQRLNSLCANIKKTPLQVSLHHSTAPSSGSEKSDPVEIMGRLAASGIAKVRIYDFSNDAQKLLTYLSAAKKYGLQPQAGLCLNSRSNANLPALVEYLEKSGCDSLCLLDLAGHLLPAAVADLVKDIRTLAKIPLHLHIADMGILACMSYFAGAQAGIEGLDTSCGVNADYSSTPLAETIIAALSGTPFDTNLDQSLAAETRMGVTARLEKWRAGPLGESSRHRPAVPLYTLTEDTLHNLIGRLGQAGRIEMSPAPPAKAAGDTLREYSVELDGEVFNIKIGPTLKPTVEIEKPAHPVAEIRGGVTSPMPGVVLSINVKVGDVIKAGDFLATVEAMKMRYDIYANEGGVVKSVLVSESDTITTETVLLIIE